MADGTDAPRLDPQALEALTERMASDTDAERDADLDAFFRLAWPSLAAQSS